MGNRRMMSKTVTLTQRFLQMPLEAQALYFHLLQSTDDDGIVEAFPIVRMIGASDDSLKLLQAKEFIKLLNSEMVYFVTDFFEQNSIQKHHYKPSRHQSLLGYEEILKNPRISKDFESDKSVIQGSYQDVSKRLSESYPKISKDKVSKDKSVEDSRSQEVSPAAEISNYYQSRIGVMDGQQYQILTDYLTLDGMELEVIKTAIDKAADNSKRSFSYINSILKNWRQNGIRTMVQVEDEQRQFQQKKLGQSDDDIQDPFIY